MKRIFRCVISGIICLCLTQSKQVQAQSSGIGVKKYDSLGREISKSGRPDIREKLVQLALQNPSVEIDDRTVAIADYTLKNTKSNVLNLLVLQGNLNEYTIAGTPQTPAGTPIAYGQYPRYNIGLTLPVGTFLTRSRDIKIGKENLGIAYAQKNKHIQELKELVLAKYEDYLLAVDLLDLENQLLEDVYTNFQKVEKDFAEAKVQSTDYTNAYRDYNNELAKQRSLDRNLRVIVLELERYIGVKLEDVLKEYK